MRKLAARLGIASITFLLGVGIASMAVPNKSIKATRLLSGPPCATGIVSVASQPEAPLRISISDTACQNPYDASVQFAVKNMSSKPIVKYEIRGVLSYDCLVDEGLGVLTEGFEHFQPHQTRTGFLGGAVLKAGDLKRFQLTVWSVDFADGTKWTRP